VKRVLVVDDDDDMRSLMSLILKGEFEVASASDGASGLALARQLRPDLIVLDLLMPKMHGFEVCRRIREDADLKATKVLISSSKSYQHDVRTSVDETGADDYIVKPFEVEEFKKRVQALMGPSA
jgi:two-component system response regulator RpaA